VSHVTLGVIDEKWKDHLYDLDQLREGIYYRAWGQKDPLVEYKQEAYEMFVGLMRDLETTFAERWLKLQIEIGPPQGGGGRVLSGRRAAGYRTSWRAARAKSTSDAHGGFKTGRRWSRHERRATATVSPAR